jgi:hypothetical protein
MSALRFVPSALFRLVSFLAFFSSLHLKGGETLDIVLRVLPVIPTRSAGYATANERFSFSDVRVGVEARLEFGSHTDQISFDVVLVPFSGTQLDIFLKNERNF